MTTLITQKVGSDNARRCDAKCYDAQHPACDCCCGGMNHGKGLQAAVDNTRELCVGQLEYIRAQGFDLDPSLAAILDTNRPQLF